MKRITISGDSEVLGRIKEEAWKKKMTVSRYMVSLFEERVGVSAKPQKQEAPYFFNPQPKRGKK